jgi:hypothetical protein
MRMMMILLAVFMIVKSYDLDLHTFFEGMQDMRDVYHQHRQERPQFRTIRTVRGSRDDADDTTFHEIPRGCVDTESKVFTLLSSRCR